MCNYLGSGCRFLLGQIWMNTAIPEKIQRDSAHLFLDMCIVCGNLIQQYSKVLYVFSVRVIAVAMRVCVLCVPLRDSALSC